jgi:hypothetical protein
MRASSGTNANFSVMIESRTFAEFLTRDADVTPAGEYVAFPRIVISASDNPELWRSSGNVGTCGAISRGREVSTGTDGATGGAIGVTVGGIIGSEGVGTGADRSIWRRAVGRVAGGTTGVSVSGLATGGGGRSGTTTGAGLDSRVVSDHGAMLRMDMNASTNKPAVTAAANPKEGQRGPCGCRSNQCRP